LIFHKTLRNIRKRHGLTQEEFAKKLECTPEHIIALESNNEPVAFEFAVKLMDAFDLHGSPITELARAALMDSLQKWKILIDYGEMDKAAALKQELEKGARESYSPSAEIFYDLFSASYYWAINDMDSVREAMAALEQRTEGFSARHWYYYYRLVAALEYRAYRHKEALIAYKAAEKLDKENKMGNVGFYFGYGTCLVNMGFMERAVEYLDKAQHMSNWSKIYDGKPNRRYAASIDGMLAIALSKLGRCDEALAILDKRLPVELKRNSREHIGFTYYSYGVVYSRKRDYDKAIDNFDKALDYLSVSGKSYKSSLQYKAIALIESDNITEGLQCIDKGLSMPIDDITRALLEALKCSVTMNDPKSLEYMEDTVMPELLRCGQYLDAVKFFKILSTHYSDAKKFERALEYSNVALEVYEQLYEERIEGGLQ